MKLTNKAIPGIICIILLFLSPQIACARPKTANDLLSEALKLRSAGHYAAATDILENLADGLKNPIQQNLARFMLGDCLTRLGKYAQARDVFDEIIASESDEEERAEALYRIAQSWALEGNSGKMRSECRKILDNHAHSPYAKLAGLLMQAETDYSSPIPGQAHGNAVNPPKPHKAPESAPTPVKAVQTADLQPKAPGSSVSASIKPESSASAVKIRPVPASHKPADFASGTNLDALKSLLSVSSQNDEERQELVTQILADQDILKQAPEDALPDHALFRLASNTARFGEYVEACKYYDRLLTSCPASDLVEEAYFESIRLRTVLKMFDQVSEWGRAFKETFPDSKHSAKIQLLMNYAKAQKIQSNSHTKSIWNPESPKFRQAKRLMNEGRFAMALLDLQSLQKSFPEESELLWEIALVQVQLEKFSEAEKSLQMILSKQPANEEARSLLAYVHYNQKKYSQAAEEYDRISDSTNDSQGLDFYDPKDAGKRLKRNADVKDRTKGERK